MNLLYESMKPKVSICIPAFNQPKFLLRTLRSIMIQTYEDFEVIITDDSPGDLVENAVGELLPNPKLIYYKNRKTLGTPENWNRALKLARGEYIKFLHHDDWFTDQNGLDVFVNALEQNPGSDFAFSSCFACDINGKVKFTHSAMEQQITLLRQSPYNLYPHNFIGAPSVTFFRRKEGKYFDPLLKWVVDIDLYINLLSGNKDFVFLPEPLVSINSGSDSQVTSECTNNRDIEVFEWLYLFFKLKSSYKVKYKNLKFIGFLLEKHQIRSVADLHRLKEIEKLSKIVTALLFFKKIF